MRARALPGSKASSADKADCITSPMRRRRLGSEDRRLVAECCLRRKDHAGRSEASHLEGDEKGLRVETLAKTSREAHSFRATFQFEI